MKWINRQSLRLLWKLTVLNAVMLFLIYLGERFIAEQNWFTTLITYAPQQLFGIPLLFLLTVSLVRKRWWILVTNIAVAIFFAFTMLGLNIPLGAQARCSGINVRMMTYNIHHASKSAEQIAEDVREINPDIICFQETNCQINKPDPVKELKRVLPGWYCASHGQLAVFSKYPITESEVHQPPVERWRVFLQVTISIKGRLLNVINLHLNKVAKPGSLPDHYGSIALYLDGRTDARAKQVARLIKIAHCIKGPLIIAGDFNTPPRGQIYHRMATNYQDSFRAVGRGLGYSFRSDIPIMRIDYIFTGKDLVPCDCSSPVLAGSDHRPVVADVAFIN